MEKHTGIKELTQEKKKFRGYLVCPAGHKPERAFVSVVSGLCPQSKEAGHSFTLDAPMF